MEYLPVEIINEILLRVDNPGLYHTVQVSIVWRQLSLKQVKLINTLAEFCDCCYEGDRLSIVRSKLNKQWLGKGLFSACSTGHKELVELLIHKGAKYFNEGLWRACRAGRKEIVELLLSKGADYYDGGLINACHAGHRELVELMIERYNEQCNIDIQKALESSDEDSVNRIMSEASCCYDEALLQANAADHKSLVELLAKGAKDVKATDVVNRLYINNKTIY